MAESEPRGGRPRDETIAPSVLDAALAELGAKGYAGFSLTSVALAADTTRPAIYRRWKDKNALIVDAVAQLADTETPETTGVPRADLLAELENFRRCISEAGSLPLAGLMLTDDLEPSVRAAYLERIVAPRRHRIRSILDAALAAGELAPDADVDVATTFLTGSWYAYRVADRQPPDDWAERVVALVWKGLTGRSQPRNGREHST